MAALMGVPAERVAVDAWGGRPTLAAPHDGAWLSLAHRERWLALALAPAPVGVDVEVVGPAREPAWNVLAAAEQAAIRRLPPARRWPGFLALWTAKEAYLKAIGLGLSREPREVCVASDGGAVRIADRGRPVVTLAAGHHVMRRPPEIVQATCVILPPPS